MLANVISLTLLSFLSAMILSTKMKRSFFSVSGFRNKLKSKCYSTTDIIALDFDGVICASSEESSYSSIIATERYWKSNFHELPDEKNFKTIQKIVSELRPIIETGYENMLVARYSWDKILNENWDNSLDEEKINNLFRSTVINEIQSNWNQTFRDDLILNYETTTVFLFIMIY
jgi:hypothetical protein